MECDRCKRALNPTMHMRESYKVEAYRLYTGNTTPVVMREDSDEELKFAKLDSPRVVTICDICMNDNEIIRALEKFEAPAGA